MVAVRDHLVLFFPVDQVVVVLHRDELMPAVTIRDVLQLLELPRRHAGRTDVPNFPRLDHIVQGAHDLLPRRRTVQAVDLQDIDVGAQPRDALVDGIDDVFPAESHTVQHVVVVDRAHADRVRRAVFGHAEVAFTQDHQVLPRDVELLYRFADDLLRLSVRIHVRGVPRPDPGLVCIFQQWK